jgi:hypothetical protein
MTAEQANEKIIASFYRTLLGREADPDGLRHHSEGLARHGGERAIDETLELFLATDESKRHLERKTMAAFPQSDAPAHQIDNVVSLGTHCYTSVFLERFNLKKFSSAFDWLFSSPSMVAHAISDDFRTFLDQQHYDPIPLEKRRDGPHANRVQHRFYHQHHGVEHIMFNHHDVHEPDDYAYLNRCVDRFRSSLQAGSRTLFLMIRREDQKSQHDFELVRDALRRTGHDCFFAFVSITAGLSVTGVPKAEVVSQDHRATRYCFSGSSAWYPLQFTDPFDEICLFRTIFKTIRPVSA